MKNLKLTTKPEILSYLEDKKFSLQKKRNIYASLCANSWVLSFCSSRVGGHLLGLDRVPFNSIEIIQANMHLGSLFMGATLVTSICSLMFFKKCKGSNYKLQETEQKIGWIKDGTLTENAMLELEKEVVEAREEKMTKVKTR